MLNKYLGIGQLRFSEISLPILVREFEIRKDFKSLAGENLLLAVKSPGVFWR